MNRRICSTALLLAAVGSLPVCLGQEHRIAVLSDDYYVYVHQASGARINTLRVSDAQQVAMNRDGSRIAVLANDYYVKLFDGDGQLLNTLRINKARDVAISGDGLRLAVISGNDDLKILDNQGKQLSDLDLNHVNAVSLNRDGSRILVLCGDYYVKLLDGVGRLLNAIRVNEAQDVALSGDGRRIAVLASGYYIKLFDPDGKQLSTLRIDQAQSIALNEDGSRIGALRAGTYARTYDEQGQQLTSFNVHKATKIAISGMPVASGPPAPKQSAPKPPRAVKPLPERHPEDWGSLRKLAGHLLDLARAGDEAALTKAVNNLTIPQYPAWFKRVFGDALGETLAAEYAESLTKRAALVDALKAEVARNPETLFAIDEFEKGKSTSYANDQQRAALRAMQEPVKLYTVRFIGTSAEKMSLWSIVYVDGAFRLAGKMQALSGNPAETDSLVPTGDESLKKIDLPKSKEQLKGAARKSAKKVLKGLLGG